MLSLAQMGDLVRNELGIALSDDELSSDFDELPEWDSMYLLKLVTALERTTGRSIAVGKLLEARSLEEIHRLAVAA